MKVLIAPRLLESIDTLSASEKAALQKTMLLLSTSTEHELSPLRGERLVGPGRAGTWSFRVNVDIRLLCSLQKTGDDEFMVAYEIARYHDSPVSSVVPPSVDTGDHRSETEAIISSLEAFGEIPAYPVEHHPNIEVLLRRMQRALADKDYAAVLHSSASIFETLAKEVVDNSTVLNQSLGAFFDRYARDSRLPDEITDYIRTVYRWRNREPLAGHGSLGQPQITRTDAVVLVELTTAIIRMERLLRFDSDGTANELD